MTETEINPNLSKSKGWLILEYILFALCLCVLALRATYTESPDTQSAAHALALSDCVYSLTISAVLIFSFALWLVWNFCSGEGRYRTSAMEVGLCIFCAAAIIACLAAADKRAAITNSIIMSQLMTLRENVTEKLVSGLSMGCLIYS